MASRGKQWSPFAFLSLITVPWALLLEMETIELGHELRWSLFGGMSETHSAWFRYGLIASAVASVICMFVHAKDKGET